MNKLTLFLVELTDQAFVEHNLQIFAILQILFKKTSRRYNKGTLSKISMFFQDRLSKESEEFCKSAPVKGIKDLLAKRSNASVSTAKKRLK